MRRGCWENKQIYKSCSLRVFPISIIYSKNQIYFFGFHRHFSQKLVTLCTIQPEPDEAAACEVEGVAPLAGATAGLLRNLSWR